MIDAARFGFDRVTVRRAGGLGPEDAVEHVRERPLGAGTAAQVAAARMGAGRRR